MKQAGDNIMGQKMIFHLINQSYEKKITFAVRQAIVALIRINEKANEHFRMEVDNILVARIKKEEMDSFI